MGRMLTEELMNDLRRTVEFDLSTQSSADIIPSIHGLISIHVQSLGCINIDESDVQCAGKMSANVGGQLMSQTVRAYMQSQEEKNKTLYGLSAVPKLAGYRWLRLRVTLLLKITV